jgi:hypothetical protein
MKRALVMVLSALGLIVGGCGLPVYEERLEATYKRMKHTRALNDNLAGPAEGKFQALNVYFRVPTPLAETAPAFTPLPGAFDHVASFQGSPPAPQAKDGAAAPPPSAPLKVHVFIRNKPKKATPKKGQAEAPDPNAALRGDFVADVRQLLTSYGPGATEKSLVPFKPEGGTTSFQSLIFSDAGTGNDIRVYFAATKDKESQVALVYDIPTTLRTEAIVGKGVQYSLESFALGRDAAQMFNAGAERKGGGDEKTF